MAVKIGPRRGLTARGDLHEPDCGAQPGGTCEEPSPCDLWHANVTPQDVSLFSPHRAVAKRVIQFLIQVEYLTIEPKLSDSLGIIGLVVPVAGRANRQVQGVF